VRLPRGHDHALRDRLKAGEDKSGELRTVPVRQGYPALPVGADDALGGLVAHHVLGRAMRGSHVAARRQRVHQRRDDSLWLLLITNKVQDRHQEQPDRPGEVQGVLVILARHQDEAETRQALSQR
jgi:hypothetical protein